MYVSITLVNLLTLVGLSFANNSKPKLISEVVDLSAVTSFKNLEKFHAELYKKNRKTYPKVSRSDRQTRAIKKELCKRIFSSTYYKMKGEDLLDTDDVNSRKKIEESFPNTFRHVFQEKMMCVSYIGDTRKYVNDYRELYIRLPDDDGQKQDYNVAEGMLDSSPMAARFVFADEEDRGFYLDAMAEEAATPNMIHVLANPELDYLKFREISEPCQKWEQDPVCKLSHNHKLRLCASVFAAKIFNNKMIFEPELANVENNCAWKEVSFLTNFSLSRQLLEKLAHHKNLERHQTYHEWMFSCKVLNVAGSKNDEELIYVSLGDRAHTVFLYSQTSADDERLFVINSMKNISVVDTISIKNDDNSAVISRRQTKNEEVEKGNVPQVNPSESLIAAA